MARTWGVAHLCLCALEDVAGFDKRLDVGSVISSTVPFKIVLQKGLTVDFGKVSGLGLFGGKSEQVRQQRFFSFPPVPSRWLPGLPGR